MVAFGINPSRLRTHLDATTSPIIRPSIGRLIPWKYGYAARYFEPSILICYLHRAVSRKHEVDLEYWRGTVVCEPFPLWERTCLY